MESLTIVQEGVGVLELLTSVPEELARYVLKTAMPVGLMGEGFKALFQRLAGKGFTIWISRYWMTNSTVLLATGHEPALELRIALRNKIKGTWEDVRQPELPALYYQMSFVPHIATRACFDADVDYETFDIHFELDYLKELGIDYKVFQLFIEQVLKDQPTDLSPTPRRCPALMLEAVQAILRNHYSEQGKAWLLQNNVENILLAALEDVDRLETILPDLSEAQIDALYEVKRLIDESLPYYPGNKKLCQQSYLNFFTLNFGFKRQFGTTPYKYYNHLRMQLSKDLLLRGEPISSVAAEVDFLSPRAFARAFKEMYSMSPTEYRATYRK
ncbi:MAG: AraC family transcriptional regulator [Niabella sp.]